jgi:hypothetical protein
MEQLLKPCGEGLILPIRPFLWPFRAPTGGPMFPGFMPSQQQGIDVVLGVFPAVLMQYLRTSRKAHGCQPIILCDHDVPGANPAHNGKIYAVCTLVEDQSLRPIPVKLVGGVAQQQTLYLVLPAQPGGDVHHGTAVGIDQNFQFITPFF